MKKSTGIVFLLAVALAAFAYFYDWKRHPAVEETNPNDVKLAFTLKAEDITQITLTRAGVTAVMDLTPDNGWYISKPLGTRADQSAVNAIAHSLATLPQDRVLQVTPDQLKGYGLDDPALVLQFKLADGTMHALRIGGKDFSNLEVYSQIDGSKDVTLITNNIMDSADKPMEDLRDHTVMFLSLNTLTSFDLHNPSGDLSVEKEGFGWKIVKPLPVPGDLRATSSMLESVVVAKAAKFVVDDAKDITPSVLAKYGLTTPSIRLRVTSGDAKPSELLLGKKEGIEYYAMDPSRHMIFRVPDSLYNKLNQTFLNLHGRVLFSGEESRVSRVEVRGQGGNTNCIKGDGRSLVIEQTADQKGAAPGTAPDCPDFLAPLGRARADKFYDQPSEELKAKLAKLAEVVTITVEPSAVTGQPVDKPGQAAPAAKKTEIQISPVSGNSVYGRASGSPTIYEFDKHAFDVLSSKPTATAK